MRVQATTWVGVVVDDVRNDVMPMTSVNGPEVRGQRWARRSSIRLSGARRLADRSSVMSPAGAMSRRARLN